MLIPECNILVKVSTRDYIRKHLLPPVCGSTSNSPLRMTQLFGLTFFVEDLKPIAECVEHILTYETYGLATGEDP